MSRKAKDRSTSRVAQIHYCAVCEQQNPGATPKVLTWMLEIPPESDTYVRLGGRARTWFCRSCIEAVYAADPIFSARNAHLEGALERAPRQQESAVELDFKYVTEGRVESLDGKGNVTRTETTRRRHYPLEGYLYSELIERDGQPLDTGDARAERERKAEFIREARRHAARGERYDPDEMSVDFDTDLMDRYHTTFAGTDVVRGDSCWVIRFEPREGRLPDNRRIDKALNRSTGFLWITQVELDPGIREPPEIRFDPLEIELPCGVPEGAGDTPEPPEGTLHLEGDRVPTRFV